MKQEDKQLLLADLCARLPWGVKCHINGDNTNTPRKLSRIEVDELDGILLDFWTNRENLFPILQVYLSEVKPYLRSMSSMTEEERKEYELLANHCIVTSTGFIHLEAAPLIDWLNKKMFAYRTIDGKDMFELGLALEAPENMYEL